MTNRRELGRKSRRQGRTAQLAVATLLDAWGWDPREETPDEGFDFNVEIPATDSRPTLRILVQVKSSDEMTVRRDGSWSVPISRKRLNDYRNHRLPVFVIGVDVSNDTFRWCDIDDETSVAVARLRIKTRGKGEKRSPDVYLRLTRDCSLSGSLDAAFEAAVIAAWKRLDDRYHPPSTAVRVREEILRQKDTRFDVTVNVVDGQEIRIIQAREKPVSLAASIRLANRESAEALLDTFRFGVPATVEATEFTIKGSALFQDLPSVGRLSVGGPGKRKRILLGYRAAQTGDKPTWEIEEDGELFAGAEGGEWRIDCQELPFRVRLRVVSNENKLILTCSLERAVWNGSDVRQLPYFNPVRRLVDGVLESGAISIGMRDQGEAVELVDVPIKEQRGLFEWMSKWLRVVLALKTVCSWANCAIKWNEAMATDQEEIGSWVQGAELIEGAKVPVNIDGFSVSGDEELLPAMEASGGNMVLRNVFHIALDNENSVDIPVLIQLSNYAASRGDSRRKIVISRTESSAAVMRLDDSPDVVPSLSMFSPMAG